MVTLHSMIQNIMFVRKSGVSGMYLATSPQARLVEGGWARGSQKWLVLSLWTVGRLMKIIHIDF